MFQDGKVEGVSTAAPVDRLALDCLIEGIAYSGLVQAIEVCKQEHPFRRTAKWIDVLVQGHLAAGKCSGLVAA